MVKSTVCLNVRTKEMTMKIAKIAQEKAMSWTIMSQVKQREMVKAFLNWAGNTEMRMIGMSRLKQ